MATHSSKNSMDRGAVGYSPWGHAEPDRTERAHTHTHTHITLSKFCMLFRLPYFLPNALLSFPKYHIQYIVLQLLVVCS